jgi:hypothetical protein
MRVPLRFAKGDSTSEPLDDSAGMINTCFYPFGSNNAGAAEPQAIQKRHCGSFFHNSFLSRQLQMPDRAFRA